MALVRKTANGHELGLARIIRGDKITVDGWRPVDLTQTDGTQVTQIADVAWLDATELLLLGAANKDAAMAPVRVTADASRVSAEGGEPANWEPAAHRALPAADHHRGRRVTARPGGTTAASGCRSWTRSTPSRTRADLRERAARPQIRWWPWPGRCLNFQTRAVSFSPSAVEVWVAAAGDLLLGASCHGCGVPWWGVCPDCRLLLSARRPGWTRPDPCPAGFPPTVTSSPYDPVLRGLINAHKERQALGLTGVLADRLTQSVRVLLARGGARGGRSRGPRPGAVGGPARPTARFRRHLGHGPVGGPAAAVADTRPPWRPAWPRSAAYATRPGWTRGPARPTWPAVSGCALRFRPGPTVLVDDLVTTGSSLSEAARVLSRAGVPVLGAATVAATERHRLTSRLPGPPGEGKG